MQMRGARLPGPADHVVQVKRHSVGVSDGDVQDPFHAVTDIIVHYHLPTLVGIVVCKLNTVLALL